jgi:hypothetical protein
MIPAQCYERVIRVNVPSGTPRPLRVTDTTANGSSPLGTLSKASMFRTFNL